tara:strand:+ start:114 stop:635 length:522 start_codon:yes stop_codon:yes gene_type:complete
MTSTYRPTPQVPALDGMTPLGVSPQKTLEERVLEWTETLCESLAENYKQYHRRMIERNSAYFNGDGKRQDLSDYAQKQIDEMDNGTWKGMKFVLTTGKKYHKITQQDWDDRENRYRGGSVHAFVDKKTGEVYKPASWRSPAKHVRYDLRIIKEREYVLNPANCGWAGGYLYMR